MAVETVFESMKRSLAKGDRIELRGFGVFNVRPRKTGIGRNPRTGAEVSIPPGKAVRFKPGKELQSIDESRASNSVKRARSPASEVCHRNVSMSEILPPAPATYQDYRHM